MYLAWQSFRAKGDPFTLKQQNVQADVTLYQRGINSFQQMSFVGKAKRQLQESPTSIEREMNAYLNYFSTCVHTPASCWPKHKADSGRIVYLCEGNNYAEV